MGDQLSHSDAAQFDHMRNSVASVVRDKLATGSDSQLLELMERLIDGNFEGYDAVNDVAWLIRALAMNALYDELVRRLEIRQMESDG